MLGLAFVVLALIGFVVGSDQKLEARLLKLYSDCSAVSEDALGSIKTVVAFGAADKFLAKYSVHLERVEKDGKKRGPFVGLMFACQYFSVFTGWAIGFYLGAYLFRQGDISDPGRILALVPPLAGWLSPPKPTPGLRLTSPQCILCHVYRPGSEHVSLYPRCGSGYRCF